MKKYKVTVNGTAYEIELEELTGATPAASILPINPLRVVMFLPFFFVPR